MTEQLLFSLPVWVSHSVVEILEFTDNSHGTAQHFIKFPVTPGVYENIHKSQGKTIWSRHGREFICNDLAG